MITLLDNMAVLSCCRSACTAVLLAVALCVSRVGGQQASPLQGQGTVPDGTTDVYFSAYLERLLKVNDVDYQVGHSSLRIICGVLSG